MQGLLDLTVTEAATAIGFRHGSGFFGRGHQAIELEEVVGLRILWIFHRAGVGGDPHDLFLDFRRLLKHLDRVVVALAHLLAVGAGHPCGRLQHAGLGEREDIAVEVVEGAGEIAADLHMLHLVVADGNGGRVVGQDVGRHQHGVGEEPRVGRQPLGLLFFVGVAPLKKAHRRDRQEQPGEFCDLRHVRLHKQRGPGRVEAEGDEIECRIVDVFPQQLRIADRGQRVQVGNEVVGVAGMLEVDVLPDGTKVVAPVEAARRLDAGEHPQPVRLLGGGLGGGHDSLLR